MTPALRQVLFGGKAVAAQGNATFVGVSKVNFSGTSGTFALPAGAAAGDALLFISDNDSGNTPTITFGSGGTATLTNTTVTSYGKSFGHVYKLLAGDIGSSISVTNSGADNYYVCVAYRTTTSPVATILSKDSEIIPSAGSLVFAGFTPSATTLKTVCLMLTFGALNYSTPTGWTADVNNNNVPTTPGFGIGCFSKAGGSGPTFTGFTSSQGSFGIEFEIAA